jgi:ArsR family transcriptional regulator, arsenate/arsenite/antimonite-responsive transcriptional repressor
MARKVVGALDDIDLCCRSLLASPIGEGEAADLAQSFSALADPARLRLLSLIASADGGEVCACELVEPVGKSQPTVSHHLKVLHDVGLVTSERRGRWIYYAVAPGRIDALRAALERAPVRRAAAKAAMISS